MSRCRRARGRRWRRRPGRRSSPRCETDVRYFRSDRGRASQMNAGARAARGDALLFLHADTQLPEEAASAIADALGDPSVVGGRFDVRFDNPRWPFRMIAFDDEPALAAYRHLHRGPGIFVRRAVFDDLGGYPDIPLMEDIELSARLKRRGRLACLSLRVTTSARKWEREGILRTILLMWTLRLLYWLGVDSHPPPPLVLRGQTPKRQRLTPRGQTPGVSSCGGASSGGRLRGRRRGRRGRGAAGAARGASGRGRGCAARPRGAGRGSRRRSCARRRCG